jgi:hypothetical protein
VRSAQRPGGVVERVGVDHEKFWVKSVRGALRAAATSMSRPDP